jgi:FRG domain
MYRDVKLNPAEHSCDDWTRLVVAHVRSGWFVEHLRHPPFGRWAMEERIDINTQAVAQHYGLPTTFIDLTESPSVAAFFATCAIRRGRKPGELLCSPLSEGVGILYRVRMPNLPFGSCRPIGLQPFPRPKEQWAWTYELWLGKDFQDPRCSEQPCVESILFHQSAELGEHFYTVLTKARPYSLQTSWLK